MKVLIVQSSQRLSACWKNSLKTFGATVVEARTQREATAHLLEHNFDAVILDLLLDQGSALAIAELTDFRHPDAKLFILSSTSYFSDGSIFSHFTNVCGFLPTSTPPDDLAAFVTHHTRPKALRDLAKSARDSQYWDGPLIRRKA